MAGHFRAIVLAGLGSAALLVSVGAQTPAPEGSSAPRPWPPRRLGPPPGLGPDRPRGPGRPGEPDGPGGPGRNAIASPEFANVRKAIEALSPEQRQRFQENFRRWSNLSADEMKALRERENWRRQRMDAEIDQALRETGLTLTAEQRQLFGQRYGEERRKVEEQIRRELDEKRRPLLRDLVARLTAEFAAPAAPAPEPTPPPPVPQP